MALVVAKFGGSSVATPERINNVAERLVKRYKSGDQVVAVVSAMGDSTDHLLEMAHQVNQNPNARELDMLLTTGEQVSMSLLAMAIEARGVDAISHTGAQVGIVTDAIHTKAKIAQVKGLHIREDLDAGKIVIVAGFQGITDAGEITTLGRGGSDTTAVAIAAALNADFCEICSDVDGVYTADPRVCPRARKLHTISYEEMLELSASGAGVLQMRSVEFARNYGVVIHARSSFNENEGTYVKEADPSMEGAIISGIAHDSSECKVTLRHVQDAPGIAAVVFERLASKGVNVDMIIQDISVDGVTDISFTCPVDDLPTAKKACDELVVDINAEGYLVNDAVAKVSIVGAGMKSNPGVAAKMFRALSDKGINIHMISTSPIRISVVVSLDKMDEAVRALHTAFDLDDDMVVSESALTL